MEGFLAACKGLQPNLSLALTLAPWARSKKQSLPLSIGHRKAGTSAQQHFKAIRTIPLRPHSGGVEEGGVAARPQPRIDCCALGKKEPGDFGMAIPRRLVQWRAATVPVPRHVR